jgi:hypothetical protein
MDPHSKLNRRSLLYEITSKVSNGPSFYALPVVISSLHGKTSRVVERPVITRYWLIFIIVENNYTAHETMDFTFQWYHKVVIITVKVKVKVK